jgi:hypothetical protein
LAPTITRTAAETVQFLAQLFWETVRAAKTGQKMRHNAHDPRSDKENNKNGEVWRKLYVYFPNDNPARKKLMPFILLWCSGLYG